MQFARCRTGSTSVKTLTLQFSPEAEDSASYLLPTLAYALPYKLKGQGFMSRLVDIRILFAVIVAIALAPSMLQAQNVETPETSMGNIIGTVTDANGDTVAGAMVALNGSDQDDSRSLVTSENGFFQFRDVKPGIAYQISITAKDFAAWRSPTITLEPGQFKIVAGIQLRIQAEHTTVDVHYSAVEVATEQIKTEETQRLFGLVPNFYVTYETDPAPLTARMKFGLPLRLRRILLPLPECSLFREPSRLATVLNTVKAGDLMGSGLAQLRRTVSLTS